MPVHAIDHFNLRAPRKLLAALRAFYCDALGLESGPRPPLRSSGLWLYAGQAPIVHLVEIPDTSAPPPRPAPAVLDHVAFQCSNLERTLERLQRLEVKHVVTQVAATRQVLVRLQDPAGLSVELVFAQSEQ
jgi:catechol 2,3-dioxygenase-like lactoylglutathione lyase family enzyme